MILYHAITMYQMLNCIVHKLMYYPSEEATLILPDFFIEKMPLKKIDELASYGFFREVKLFPYTCLKPQNGKIEKQVEALYKKNFDNSLKSYDDIYIAGIHFYFTILLIKKHISFYAFEEAGGAYTRQYILVDALNKRNKEHYDIADHYQLLDYSNEYIKKVICNYNAQVDNVLDTDKTFDFNIQDALEQLDKSEVEKILLFFEVPELDFSANSALLFTQHFMNLDLLTYDAQADIYQTFCDYFLCEKRIYVKPHPDDFMNYKDIIQESTIIKRDFPTELLPYITKKQIDTCATIYSTALSQISNYYKNTILLDMEYRNSYRYAKQYFVSLSLLLYLDPLLQMVHCIGIDEKHLLTMGRHTKELKEISCSPVESDNIINCKYILVDNIKDTSFSREDIIDLLHNISEDTIVLFMNNHLDYCFYDYSSRSLAFQMIPIEIKCYSSNSLSKKPEIIMLYAYTKRKEIRQMIEDFECHKELVNSQQNVNVNKLSSEQIQIKVLEGVLKATEERLLYYINLEKERRDEE